MDIRKKFIIKISLFFLIGIIVVCVIKNIVYFPVNTESVLLLNIQSNETEISFDVLQRDSGYFLANYKTNIEGDSLFLQFWGTPIALFSAKIPAEQLVIPTGCHIKKIYIASNNNYFCVWED